MSEFEILGGIDHIEIIASGRGVHIRHHLERTYGAGRWRKMKGVANVRLQSGIIRNAELHWYEAHGNGRKKMKIKRLLD